MFIAQSLIIKDDILILYNHLLGVLPMNDSNFIENVAHPAPPPWVMIVGICFAVLTLLFLMALTIMSVIGYRIECQSRFLIVTVFAFGAALSTAFLGGDAAAKVGFLYLLYKNTL
jgi:hypothetical protein